MKHYKVFALVADGMIYSMKTHTFRRPHLCAEVKLHNLYNLFPKKWNMHLTVTTKFLSDWTRTKAGEKVCKYKMQKYRGLKSKVGYQPRQSYQIAFSAFSLEDVRLSEWVSEIRRLVLVICVLILRD